MLIVLIARMSKRHEKNRSYKQHHVDDLLWQSSGLSVMVIIQARSQELMEEKHLSRRNQAYLRQQSCMQQPGAPYSVCLIHIYTKGRKTTTCVNLI